MNRRRHAFTLIEVLVALTILAVTLSMVMRSFTVSLRAARMGEEVSTATILARGLIEKWELEPPEPGLLEGTFGEEFRGYSYEGECREMEMEYEEMPDDDEIGRLARMTLISLRVYHTPPSTELAKRTRLLQVETALTGADKYTPQARKANDLGFQF